MPTATMSVAHDARAIASDLIREHHRHLSGANILYVFTDQKRKRCDRVRLGSAAKLSALQRFLASGMDSVEDGADFVMLIDSNQWALLSKAARQALVDHELCHMAVFVKDMSQRPSVWMRWTPQMPSMESFEEWRYGMRGHDIEEFGEVLYRHGWWKPDQREQHVRAIALQLEMPANGKVEGKVEAKTP